MREHNVRCTLNVNATMRDTLVRVDATLLEVLRENLDLTGTKRDATTVCAVRATCSWTARSSDPA